MTERRCRRGMRVIAAIAVAGCGAAPPPAAAPRPAHVNVARWTPDAVAVPRPAVEVASVLPDFTEELRWPLPPSVHPELEPSYPVAAQLADPGVTWHELCAMGAQHRHVPGRGAQLVTYLGAWCSAAAHDDEEAIAQLASLGATTIDGLADALPIDLADLLADAGTADDAEHLIAKYDLRDVAVLDDLAAVYVELGQPEAARTINHDAIDLGARSREANRCHRAARDLVLGPSLARPLALENFETAHIAHRKVRDPVCLGLDVELACWVKPGDACESYFLAQGIDPRYTALLDAYDRWPDGEAMYAEWQAIASNAASADGLPGAKELADAALTAAVEVSGCSFHRIEDLHALERTLGAGASVVEAAFQHFCMTPAP